MRILSVQNVWAMVMILMVLWRTTRWKTAAYAVVQERQLERTGILEDINMRSAILAVVFVILANLHNSVQDPVVHWDASGQEIDKTNLTDRLETPQPIVAHQANQTRYMMRYSDANGTYYLHPLEQ